ncbi:MAG: GIY-YIG nuclease family protein [Promethearchaeia archaeon]
MKGSYILVILLERKKIIKIGSLRNILFSKGFYLYVGSAMGNIGSSTLLNRVKRHFLNKREKKFHWHIDYLLADKNSLIAKLYLIPSIQHLECIIAREFLEQCDDFIKDFGSSDCNCISHLFYFQNFKDLNIVKKRKEKMYYLS